MKKYNSVIIPVVFMLIIFGCSGEICLGQTHPNLFKEVFIDEKNLEFDKGDLGSPFAKGQEEARKKWRGLEQELAHNDSLNTWLQNQSRTFYFKADTDRAVQKYSGDCFQKLQNRHRFLMNNAAYRNLTPAEKWSRILKSPYVGDCPRLPEELAPYLGFKFHQPKSGDEYFLDSVIVRTHWSTQTAAAGVPACVPYQKCVVPEEGKNIYLAGDLFRDPVKLTSDQSILLELWPEHYTKVKETGDPYLRKYFLLTFEFYFSPLDKYLPLSITSPPVFINL